MYVWQDPSPSSVTGPSQDSACPCCLSTHIAHGRTPPLFLTAAHRPGWLSTPGSPLHVDAGVHVCVHVCLP